MKDIKMVYVVTSYGKIVGVFADSKDAFDSVMSKVNKGVIAEMIPCSVIYPHDH